MVSLSLTSKGTDSLRCEGSPVNRFGAAAVVDDVERSLRSACAAGRFGLEET